MTQYRVNTRNCEAKRMDVAAPREGPERVWVRHVGAPRQHTASEHMRKEAVAGTSMEGVQESNGETIRGCVPAQAGVPAPHYGKLPPPTLTFEIPRRTL
jgi:hypothetical protein